MTGMELHATTILTVRHQGRVAMAGDGQVTLGTAVMKSDAVKIRRLAEGTVLCGFAGGSADAFALLERFESKLKDYPANVPRAATELAKDWRTDRVLRRLEALLAVADAEHSLLVSGTGDVISPTDGILGIGSGGNYALAAARALAEVLDSVRRRDRPRVTADRRGNRHLHEHQHRGGGVSVQRLTGGTADLAELLRELTPRHIVTELDRHIVGQHDAKRAVAIAIRNRWRRKQLADDMRPEVSPKNILMIGPTGVGKTEIARRLAKLTGAPFIKVEATKYTEVGYYGRDVESMVRELVENAIGLVRERERVSVQQEAQRRMQERLLDLLLPRPVQYSARRAAGGRRTL